MLAGLPVENAGWLAAGDWWLERGCAVELRAGVPIVTRHLMGLLCERCVARWECATSVGSWPSSEQRAVSSQS